LNLSSAINITNVAKRRRELSTHLRNGIAHSLEIETLTLKNVEFLTLYDSYKHKVERQP
jgi:hypothetical protein